MSKTYPQIIFKQLENNRNNTCFFFLMLFSVVLLFQSCQTTNGNTENYADNTPRTLNVKQKGAHIFGRMDSSNIKILAENNIEWVTLVPYANQNDFDTPEVTYHFRDSLHMARKDSMWASKITTAHNAGYKVFLKPHVWMSNPSDGKWRSDIYPTDEKAWDQWQVSYRAFILKYAETAQAHNVEMFCIGAEFTKLTLGKSAYWEQLIKDVRKIYNGKLTYAANWYEEYEKITFWEQLDFIGIQAYFPLVSNENPTTKELSKAWKKYLPELKSMHKKYDRKILFTELGYKSTPDSAIEPWTWLDYGNTDSLSVSLETQANCYQAFFDTVWSQDWFAGTHIWQIRIDARRPLRINHDFTPISKPAEKVIKEGFK